MKRLEQFLAIAGMVVCLVVTLLLWLSISADQPVWSFPSLYFVELVFLSGVNAVLWALGKPSRIPINWAVTGIFCVFMLFGAFSVGFLYLPTVLIFGFLAILADLRTKQKIGLHLVIFLIAGVLQAAYMFSIYKLFYLVTPF